MSKGEVLACRNPVWSAFTTRVVIPWVFSGQDLSGDVLELGSGAGANATALLRRHPTVRLTATDLDPRMVDATRRRLAPFGERAVVRVADATQLDDEDASYDSVVSMIMLHHIGRWKVAIAEARRVLRPGGLFIGFDLTSSGPAGHLRGRHADRAPHHFVSVGELHAELHTAGFVEVRVDEALRGLVARFCARNPARPSPA